MVLQKQTPYMLRNDGVILRCGQSHPYIMTDIDENPYISFGDLFSTNRGYRYVLWFFDNTNDVSIKSHIQSLAISYNTVYGLWAKQSWKQDFDVGDNEDTIITDKDEISSLVEILNRETNNEFCRVRTSDMYYQGNDSTIYFRISSIGFNWFDLIWQIIYDNRNIYDFVTIVRDDQSTKTINTMSMYYKLNGKRINNMPISDFINIGGNPIIENRSPNYNSRYDVIMESLGSGVSVFDSVYGNIYTKTVLLDRLEKQEVFDGCGWHIGTR